MHKRSLFILPLLPCLFIVACGKESSSLDVVLFGTWNVTKVQGQQYNDGSPGLLLTDNNPSGYVRFDDDGTGEQNYTYTLFGVAYPNTGEFVWESNEAEIIIKRFAQPDLVWRRITNEANRQEAVYRTVVNSTQYWDYTLTLQR